MSEGDFNYFLNAFDNYQRAEGLKQSIHKISDISSQNVAEQANSSKSIQCYEFAMLQDRKASMSTHIKHKKSHSISIEQTLTSMNSEFKAFPLPTQNMLSMIYWLKEIEDEIEDDE